jgi:signal transduction histidine kinase
MDWGRGSPAGRGFACTARRQAPPGRSPTLSKQSRRRTRHAHARRRTPWPARRRLPRQPGLPPRSAGSSPAGCCPLRTITAAARRISASSLHERLALPGPDDELKELADTLDSLFARLEDSFDAQRRFAASASHELRTPLTRERTLLQVTLADPAATTGTWQAVSRELLASNAEQERLIEALLTLASSEASPGEREPADLAAITSAALAAARPAISRLGLHVQTDIQPAALDGDPLLVQQLAANLIDNAVRHNIPGGDIHVTTTTSDAGAVLSVTSSGQVIPAAEVDRLFRPFQRLGPRSARRDGHGLGLSIVRAIATAHAATITAQPRPGGGLAINITFPPP